MPAALKNLPDDVLRHRILDSAETAAFLGRGVYEIRRLHRAGKMPPAVRIDGRRLGWPVGTLIAWIESKTEKAQAA